MAPLLTMRDQPSGQRRPRLIIETIGAIVTVEIRCGFFMNWMGSLEVRKGTERIMEAGTFASENINRSYKSPLPNESWSR